MSTDLEQARAGLVQAHALLEIAIRMVESSDDPSTVDALEAACEAAEAALHAYLHVLRQARLS